MEQIFILAFAVSAVSLTLTKSHFGEGIRNLVAGWHWLDQLLSCWYCVSHWVAFGVVVLYRPGMPEGKLSAIDYVTATFALVGVSAIISGLISLLMRTNQQGE